MKNKGFSLMEMLIVIAIAGILISIGIASLGGLSRKYNVDNQVREIYSDLTNVRIMAMNKNRTHVVTLSANGYSAYDDSSPAPDGDGTITLGTDGTVLTSNKSLDLSTVKTQDFFTIAWSNASAPEVVFNSKGIATTLNTICVYSTVQPLYDCIKVSATRITLGKLTTQGVCSAANCQTR